MRRLSLTGGPVSRMFWWLLSVPLFFKIMGIGLVVATVFGGVTLLQIRGSTSHALHKMLEERTRSMAHSLAASLERPISTHDWFGVRKKLKRTQEMFPDVCYVIIRDDKGQVVRDSRGQILSTFERAVPYQLMDLPQTPVDAQEEMFQVFDSQKGLVFDLVCPILGGDGGMLQLGVTDQIIHRELADVTPSVLWSLALCATIGAGLALLLTLILTLPIHHLVQAANRVRAGDFETRSAIFSADEIGRLALAFNQMTESLHGYRQEVQEKERVRLALIEKIVHAQEEERKSISRELHDQLGQSLLALLLVVQSLCGDGQAPQALCSDIEGRIRQLIDEVGRLAWGMRPSILDDYGLDSALARQVEEMSSHFEIPIDYQYSCSPGLGRLPDRIEVTLYRIAQEALTNVVRHARATQASAIVLQRQDEVTLLVEDNGRGFDIDSKQTNSDSCLGLTGMNERAALLGGTCAVESVPEQGTTVRVRIPLSEAQKCLSAS